ncbi:hypothetical protein Q8A67_009359 [Cirrhinus molitorella]|uniref:non-specific serine/threonine protein kinase n=1 Tax=Cirrhinus molitorella TaxID=172907 RepID=A0AA88Q1M3_9TELE|nr:hypothetical protein Q8A67_009359 [Cirrhinus molitorella]
MGQRISRVFPVNGEVYDHHHSTPPKPGTDTAEQHLHPCDEPPVDAGEGHAERKEEEEVEVRREEEEVQREEERKEAEVEVEEEEKKKRKKRFWRLPSFLRAARKHLSMIRRGQTEVQLIEPASPASRDDNDIMCRYELGDRLGVGGFGVVHEASRVEDGLKVAVKDVMKTRDMEYLSIVSYLHSLTN